jgi:DNA-binding transcriptional LysR family regulator
LPQRGLQPGIVMEVQVHQTIASLVSKRIGIALVPQSLARLGLPIVAF